MPILLQEMIGEYEGSSIPKSGVLFTEDPENQPLTGTGIQLLQGTYGHADAIVSGKQLVDTYLISSKRFIAPKICNKAQRLIPNPTSQGEKLIEADNLQDFCNESTFTFEEIQRIHRVGQHIHALYGKPMDIEFTLQDGVIYVVQARPIIHKPSQYQPSYLINQNSISPPVKGEIIGTGHKAVCTISDNNYIEASTVKEALHIFLSKSPEEQKNIFAVIVHNMAPSASHEAIMLRLNNVPVVCINKSQPFLNMVFSPQQGLFITIENYHTSYTMESGICGFEYVWDVNPEKVFPDSDLNACCKYYEEVQRTANTPQERMLLQRVQEIVEKNGVK